MQLQSDASNSILDDGQFFIIHVGQYGEGNNSIRIDNLNEIGRDQSDQ